MEIVEVDSNTFTDFFPKPYFAYSSGIFALLNQDKAEKVFYLVFKDSKTRLGIVVGLIDNSFFSPFSAPFGGLVYLRDDIKIGMLDSAIQLLLTWARGKNVKTVNITLPPTLYNETFISKQMNSLFTNKFVISNIDLNYAYCLAGFSTDYPSTIWPNARNKLTIAFKNDLSFLKCEEQSQKEAAYNIIKINRLSKGYPLKLTWRQIEETSRVIDADFFLVKSDTNENIGSAIVFYVAKDIVQVIYWGDLSEYAHLKTMNFLSYSIFGYYKNLGVKIVDLGPSTENSVPNYGLCEFKESIGCNISSKTTFKYEMF
jgi:hypothetical protein